MDTLLNPDIGLLIWTIISFLLLVALLRIFAWGPLLGAVEEREHRLQNEREAAEGARQAAEKLKAELDQQLALIQARTQEALSQAMQQGAKTRDEIVRAAQDEAKALLEKSRRQLEEEKERLVRELRKDVSELSVRAAERLIKKSVDAGVQKSVLDDFLGELGGKGGRG
jgi:F-type H+-transporting ATPase subunit b